eukprot:SM000193S05178  [mRNA]  locus=s193:117416:118452:+ [translate_table: standard]
MAIEWSDFFDQAELRPARPPAPAAPSEEEPPSASRQVSTDSLAVEEAALDCAGADESGTADEPAVSPAQLDGEGVCEPPDFKGQAVRDDEASCTEAAAAAAAAGEAATRRPAPSAADADDAIAAADRGRDPAAQQWQELVLARLTVADPDSAPDTCRDPRDAPWLLREAALLGRERCLTELESLAEAPLTPTFAARYLGKDDRRPAGPDMQDCPSTPMLSTPSLGLSPPATCQQLKPGRGNSSGNAEAHYRLPSPFHTPGEDPGSLYSCQRRLRNL